MLTAQDETKVRTIVKEEISGLNGEISGLNGKVSSLDEKVSDLAGRVGSLEESVDSLRDEVRHNAVLFENIDQNIAVISENISTAMENSMRINDLDKRLGFVEGLTGLR